VPLAMGGQPVASIVRKIIVGGGSPGIWMNPGSSSRTP